MTDTSSAAPHLLFEQHGHVAIVTMNRPETKNAFRSEMLVRMYDAWLEVDQNPDIRAGDRDRGRRQLLLGHRPQGVRRRPPDNEYSKRFAEDDDLHWKALLRHFIPVKPMIAAVEGYALAGGTEILQAMDIRVAAESAMFGIAEVAGGCSRSAARRCGCPPDPLHVGRGDVAHRPVRAR